VENPSYTLPENEQVATNTDAPNTSELNEEANQKNEPENSEERDPNNPIAIDEQPKDNNEEAFYEPVAQGNGDIARNAEDPSNLESREDPSNPESREDIINSNQNDTELFEEEIDERPSATYEPQTKEEDINTQTYQLQNKKGDDIDDLFS